jgi:predicted outer membrane repeat protein
MNGMDFKFSAGEVSGNTADSGGGGIFMYMPMSITGTAKIMNNNATIGGGLYRYGHAAYPGGSVITDDAQISGNTAQKSGGGIYVVGDAISLAGSAKVSNNKAASGGGIFEDSNGKLFISEKAEISGNEASANGGGIACAYVTHMSGGSVSGNKAVKLGGGVYSSGELTLSGGAISGNSVSDVAGLSGGGGIANAGRLMISGGEISSNSALDSGYGGGGVLNKGEGSVRASFTFDGGVISGNKAYVGGGVTNYNRNTFTMLNGTVSGNTANYNGGGLYNSTDADFSMSGGAFLKNTATQDSGGAIYQSGANAMPISGDIRFSGNRAGEDGGAIWVSQSNRSSVTVSDRVEFSKNRAKTGYELDPADLVEYNTFVGATVFSWGMTYGWNNHDISYTSGTEVPFVEPPDGEHAAYVSGYPDGTIRPNSGVTRAEAATMFYRLISAGFELTLPGGGKAEFSDVAPEQWYYGFITPLAEMTLLSGYPDGSFRPDQPITRAEFAAIAARIASLSGVQAVRPPLEFSDVNENDWYSSALDTATAVGWLAGDGDIFRPQDGLTRAEFMASANNMTGRLPHTKEDIVMPPADGLRTWPDNADTSSWYYLAVQEATNSHEYVRTEDRGGAQYDYERWLGLK